MKITLQNYKQPEIEFSASLLNIFRVYIVFLGFILTSTPVNATDSEWITVHQRPPIAQLQELDAPKIMIIAIRFEQQGVVLNKLPLTFQEGETISFELKFECLAGHWEQPQELTLAIRGEGPNISQKYLLDMDLCSSPGSSTYFEGTITLPRYHINGDTTLSFQVASLQSEEDHRNLLFLAPVRIAPALLDSNVTQEAINAVFTEDAIRLRSRFRLGKNASIEIPVPENLPFQPRRLGIISRIEYTSSHRQEEQVCRVQMMHAGEVSNTTYLRNGVHTGFGNIHYYPAGKIALKDIPIFDSWASRVPNMLGADYNIQLYYSIQNLPVGPAPKSIVLEYIKPEGIMEVRDVLLLP